MPYTLNQAKKDAKAALQFESTIGATTKVKEASTNVPSKQSGVKGQKENIAPIHNDSISNKANGGKGQKGKVAPVQESSADGAGKAHGKKAQKDKAATQSKGSKGAKAKSKA